MLGSPKNIPSDSQHCSTRDNVTIHMPGSNKINQTSSIMCLSSTTMDVKCVRRPYLSDTNSSHESVSRAQAMVDALQRLYSVDRGSENESHTEFSTVHEDATRTLVAHVVSVNDCKNQRSYLSSREIIHRLRSVATETNRMGNSGFAQVSDDCTKSDFPSGTTSRCQWQRTVAVVKCVRVSRLLPRCTSTSKADAKFAMLSKHVKHVFTQ